MGSKGGAMARAFASHQCNLGSNPGVNTICGLSLLLVLSVAPRGFSPVFLSPQKPTFLNSSSTWNQVHEEPLLKWMCYLQIVIDSYPSDAACGLWFCLHYFAIALTLKLSFVYVIKYWTQLFTINLTFLFLRYQVQCNMASAVMICFLWKSLQEKREYNCFPVNHIACKQALRLQRATRGERERVSERRSSDAPRSRATSRDFPKWRACSQAINHSA